MISAHTHTTHQPRMAHAAPHEETYHEPQVACLEQRQPPLIGIPIAVSPSDQGPLLHADAAGAWAIERMGGRVFLLPLWPFPPHKHRYQSLWPLIASMDGLLLPAGIQGTDWYTHWQECESRPGPQTWTLSWEIALAQLASSVGMPILALAEGAEKWNVALGGSVRERTPNQSPDVPVTLENWEHQTIRVRANSRLAIALKPALAPSTREHPPWTLPFMPQPGIAAVAPGLRSCAQSEQTATVAFERKDTAFGLGILGRLDWGLEQVYGTTLVEAFLHASQSFALARQQNTAWEAARDTICTTLAQRVIQGLPLLPMPQMMHKEASQHVGTISPPSVMRAMGPQEHFRQRSHPPTKEALNTIRRQRLKTNSR